MLIIKFKCIWLWPLFPRGSNILKSLINSFCEDNTRSSTLPPLGGSSTCWVRKQSGISSKKASLSAALAK